MSGTVDDETSLAIETLMGSERGLVEYTAFILWLNWIMRMMQALKTGDATDQEVDQLIRDLESGARQLPDYRTGTSTPESRYAR